MRTYHFSESILSNTDIENITTLIVKIKEGEVRIANQKKLLRNCKNCKDSRKTVKEGKKLIKKYLKELKETYGIEVEEVR